MTSFCSSFRLFPLLGWLLLVMVPLACVDPETIVLSGTNDVLVVDGTITNLAEPQIIRLNRSQADRLTGRFGTVPVTKVMMEVVVDSTQVVPCHETVDGSYQLPSDFKGQVGHAYQLRFTLSDGTKYVSNQQVMPAVSPIDKVIVRFNPTSLPPGLLNGFTAGFDLAVDTQDPPYEHNYYRWDWKLYEKQEWCKTCMTGHYMTNKLMLVQSFPNPLTYQTQPDLLEDCFAYPASELRDGTHVYSDFLVDYTCRTQCWETIYNHTLYLFDDLHSNGGLIAAKRVGQVPFYTHNSALIDIRQSSLTADAYRFFNLLNEQVQNTGGLADAPPAALVGNVRNVTKPQEKVVGYFTAGAVSSRPYWLDKKDASGIPLGGIDAKGNAVPGEKELFYALNSRLPKPEPQPSQDFFLGYIILGGGSRPPTALCVPSDSKTPFKPLGWRD